MSNNIRTELTLKKEFLWTIALTVFFTINMNHHWNKLSIVWYGSVLFVLAMYVVAYNGRFPIKLSSFSLWFLSFMGLSIISLVWSLSASTGFTIIKSLIVLFVVLLVIQFAMDYRYSINTLLKSYFIATIINMIYVFSVIDISKLGDAQLGVNILDGWNGNSIGFMLIQGALIGIYLLGQYKDKFNKILFLFGSVALSYTAICTGSRTAFIMLVAALVMYFCLAHPTKIVRNIIITIIILCGALYLVMNVESFYNVLGSRLEGLFALFSGKGEVDSSSDIRDTFIQNGKRWFMENPIVGYGINNYKVLNREATGRFTYAHNNFVELAVDLGVVGLIWYYSVYVYLGKRFVSIFKESSLNRFLFASLAASLISQYGTVSYYGFYQNFLLMLCFYAVAHTNKEGMVS